MGHIYNSLFQICIARQIPCPNAINGGCEFKGHIRAFLHHIRETGHAQMSIYEKWNRNNPNDPFETDTTFQCHVGDYKTGPSVFEREETDTYWKPNLFLSKKTLTAGIATLIASRYPDQTWRLMVLVMVSKRTAKQWTVNLTVSDFDRDDAPVYSYKGQPVSCELSSEEALHTGKFLVLSDDQVRGRLVFS